MVDECSHKIAWGMKKVTTRQLAARSYQCGGKGTFPVLQAAARNRSATEAAVAGRRLGSLARQSSNKSSSASGMAGFHLVGRSGGVLAAQDKRWAKQPSIGSRLVSI
jgi:hypothetical protein